MSAPPPKRTPPPPRPPRPTPPRQVYLLQRKDGRLGAGLAKTTGWVHRATLKARDVEFIAGVSYDRIDDAGLHLTVGDTTRLLAVDDVVICAGQEARRGLYDELRAAGLDARVIGLAARRLLRKLAGS